MTNEHTYLEKYTSHTLFERIAKGLCMWGELEWTDCNILTPISSVFSSTFFSFCWAAQSGVLRAHSPLLGATASYLQLTEPVCGTGLYNCLTPTCFLWSPHLYPIQPVHSQGYTLISSTGCTCHLHRCISYLTARPMVNMSHLLLTSSTLWLVCSHDWTNPSDNC